MFFFWDDATEFFVGTEVSGIDAVITDHLEIRFRDVSDKSLHERQCGNGFVNKFVVFMSVVVESDGSTVVAVDAGGGNNRAAEVSADVF